MLITLLWRDKIKNYIVYESKDKNNSDDEEYTGFR